MLIVKHFGHRFAIDATKIVSELPDNVRSATSVASFGESGKSSKLTCLRMPISRSLHISPAPFLYDLALKSGLMIIHIVCVKLCFRGCQLIEIQFYKSSH